MMSDECGTMSGLPDARSGSARQLVYRQKRTDLLYVEQRQGAEFKLLATWGDLASCLGAARRCFGLVGLLKTAAKLATSSRLFYAVMVERNIVSWGGISVSFCGHYRVEKMDVVIGPVWTVPESRGQGFATMGLRMAINAMIGRGHRVFFIDTSETNIGMQKVIARCGFGEPVSSYPRADRCRSAT